jgi:hypothetical protein
LANRPRGGEILEWLKKHPGVTPLDDERDELDELPLFQSLSRARLTGKIACAVVRYLNGKTDRHMRANCVLRFVENVGSSLRGHPG